MVEEIAEDVPGTPEHTQPGSTMPYRSPGAASEMSGTTAISSFTMVEAESLDPKFILKHLRKLYDSAEEFLEYLAPENGSAEDDMRNIREIQKPDSDFSEEYRDFDLEFNVHLKHYKSEDNDYIPIRAIHRALFHSNGDVAAARSGLDLILYLTNLVIFAKRMIHSDRDEKSVWDALRRLDNSFPIHFMRELVDLEQSALAGQSTLVDATYSLALDLRTQLAILVLRRSFDDSKGNADEILDEVFFQSDFSQGKEASILRGWGVSVAGEEAVLPTNIRKLVFERIDHFNKYFLDEDLLQQDKTAPLEHLATDFPWAATIVRILDWARLRRKELLTSIHEIGGAATIWRNVKGEIEQLQSPPITRDTPRKKPTSFGRDRRRSSRKFNPNAPVDLRAKDAMEAKAQNLTTLDISTTRQELDQQIIEQVVEEPKQQERPVDHGTSKARQDEQPIEQVVDEARQEEAPIEQIAEAAKQGPTVVGDQQDGLQPVSGDVEEQIEKHKDSGPPSSIPELHKALKGVNLQKENRPPSIFDRQAGAERVEFGDGFDDTQPTPGPSNKGKGKQPVQSSSKKRQRPAELADDSDSDAFQTEDRGTRVEKQRRKAPVAKKVRIDPTSSNVPPSHQPPPRNEIDQDYVPEPEEAQSESEGEQARMTEHAPPPSTYESQKQLAQRAIARKRLPPKPRTKWSIEEEEAFMAYMRIFPGQYSAIKDHDKKLGGDILHNRTQVNLKDKARTMAATMMK